MFYYHQNFMETLVHQCADADKKSKWARQRMAAVRRHDTRTYMLVMKNDGDHEMVDVKFCPFCSARLDDEQIADKPLKLELIF